MISVEDRKKYIKNKCLDTGVFKGSKKEIHKNGEKWYISHKDQFGTSSEKYDSLDEAVVDYVALEQVYGEDEV